MLFAAIPALRLSAVDTAGVVRTSTSPGRDAGRWRGALLIGEVALSMMLLAGAGLLLRSFVQLTSLNPGFASRNVLTMSVSVPDAHYKNSAAVESYWDQTLTQLQSLPGLVSVAAVTPLPLSGDSFSSSFQIAGRRVAEKMNRRPNCGSHRWIISGRWVFPSDGGAHLRKLTGWELRAWR